MFRTFHRRAFVLLAFVALEHGTACAARADGDTLWDLLSRTDQVSGLSGNGGSPGSDGSDAPRRSLGPVPGITVPDDDPNGNLDDIFEKPKRHSIFGPVGDWFDNLEKATGSKITAKGHQTTSLQYASVSGSDAEYKDEQYYGQGGNGLYSDTELDVDATLFKYLTYQTQISNSPFHNPNDNKLKLDYNTKPIRVQYGDLNAGISGNSLIDFSRYMRGIMINDNWTPQFRTTELYCVTKATPQTVVIAGNGTTGPYYIYSGQIVDGSVQVRVDNNPMVQGSDKDYTLDPYSGELNFTAGHIILPTSSIAVTFEALSVTGDTGTVYGARTDIIPHKGTNLGFEYIEQDTGVSATNPLRTEQFAGQALDTWYNTAYPIDITKPVVVMYGNVTLTPGQFVINTSFSTPTQFMMPTISVPSTVTVTIEYYPQQTTATVGNRSVMGADLKQTLGKWGTMSFEAALSKVNVNGTDVSGRAAQVRFDLTPTKTLHTSLTVKDIGATFSSIQSPGFNQNEKSVTVNTDYDPNKKAHVSFTWEKALRPSYGSSLTPSSTTGLLATTGLDDYNEYDLGFRYKLASNTNLNITRNSTGTDYALGGNSTSVTDAVTLNWSHKKLSADLSLNQNESNILSTYSELGLTSAPTGGSSLLTNNSSTLGERLNLSWQSSKALTIGGSISQDTIKSNSEGVISENNVSDAQANASLKVNKNLSMRYSLDLSDTGNLGATPTTTTTTTAQAEPLPVGLMLGSPILTGRQAAALILMRDVSTSTGTSVTTGTTTTTSLTDIGTLGGGGTNSTLGTAGNYGGILGSTTNVGTTSFGGKSLSNRISGDYHPKKNLQLSAHLDSSSSIGTYEYNSDSHGIGFDVDWQMSKRLKLHTTYETRQLVYTGNFGGSNTTTVLATLGGKPFGGKLDLQLSYQSMQTNSNFNAAATSTTPTTTPTTLTNTSMNLNSINFRIDYPISSRESLFTQLLVSDSTGYLANTENDLDFGLDFNLTQTLKFSLGWQIVSHQYANTGGSTANTASLNYSVSSLLAQFGFHF